MAQHKPTPEEQLLKLIENPSAQKQPEAKPAPPEPKQREKKEKPAKKADSGGIKHAFSQFFSRLSRPEIPKEVPKEAPREIPTEIPKEAAADTPFSFLFNLKWWNRILLATVLASLIYLGVDVFFLRPDHESFLATVSTADAVYPLAGEKTTAPDRDLTYFQEIVQRRNPFMPIGLEPFLEEAGDALPTIPAPYSDAMDEAISELRLVGVSMGREGPLAMIEDVTTGRTYFLKKGQEFKNVKIQSISSEKVTVTYQGEEGALY